MKTSLYMTHTSTLITGGVSAVLLTLSMQQFSAAHGYVSSPEARGYACKTGKNVNCGSVQWEPQSLEAPDGFPEAGPADGKIASAAQVSFSPLDEQTSIRWHKHAVRSGVVPFTWTFTANHVSRNWRYYITKPNWNANSVLTRNSFDLTPFCTESGNMVRPPMNVTHDCRLPADRTGHHIVLAVWEVGDTVNSFYNVIDLNIEGGTGVVDPWADVGDINPSTTLQTGDLVKTRVFDNNGERPDKSTVLEIKSNAEGASHYWPYLLAQKINADNARMKAGQKNEHGDITPAHGKNDIFVLEETGIVRVEVTIDQVVAPSAEVDVLGLLDTYMIENGQATVKFNVKTNADMTVTSSVFDHYGTPVGFESKEVNKTSAAFAIPVDTPRAGHYHLVVKAEPKNGGEIIQKDASFFLEEKSTPNPGEADYTFPDQLSSYTAGTKVLQPKNGKIYECKPFPYSGYCIQWNSGANQFEPGVGSHWTEAWIELN